jgi:hypothetical protein
MTQKLTEKTVGRSVERVAYYARQQLRRIIKRIQVRMHQRHVNEAYVDELSI